MTASGGDADQLPTVLGMTSAAQHARNRYAAAKRHGKDSRELEQLRRDLELVKLSQHVKEVAASLAPLTDAERQRVAELLDIV